MDLKEHHFCGFRLTLQAHPLKDRLHHLELSMSLTSQEVRHVALLSRLQLSEAEVAAYTEQLGKILGYINTLNQLDTTGVEPMITAAASGNVFREDKITPGLPREAVLGCAPDQDGEYFKVPAVIE
jgi:aspartyl-tRNA(Asn)/glutamyl-tRNA(Gln) amidotransferase subunit C